MSIAYSKAVFIISVIKTNEIATNSATMLSRSRSKKKAATSTKMARPTSICMLRCVRTTWMMPSKA